MTNDSWEDALAGIKQLCLALVFVGVQGCGAETATTAATGATIKAKQMEEAKKTLEQTQQKLDDTMKQADQRPRE